MRVDASVAYFSMEIGLDVGIPSYTGGLGILAGDTLRAAADLSVPMIAVTLLYRKGYFYQRLDSAGNQTEEPVEWSVDDYLTELPFRVEIRIAGRTVGIRTWEYNVVGAGGYELPVYFLDCNLPQNDEDHRRLTDELYGGDMTYRLSQEMVLGIGGVRMLRAIGYHSLRRFHMNEGHASLLALELLDEQARNAGRKNITEEDIKNVREMCVFTTHTAVSAGHDQFPIDMAMPLLGRSDLIEMKKVFCCEDRLNMTFLALNLSSYVNGVAKKHQEVSSLMFAGYRVEAITNGVHPATWIAPPFAKLFHQYIPGWVQDSFGFRSALSIPRQEIWDAHMIAKQTLMKLVNAKGNAGMDKDVFTIGFARRATAYKRPDLLFTDIDRLKQISQKVGPLQIVYAGKAHPKDQVGKKLIRDIFQWKAALKGTIRVTYLENYDMEIARILISGSDIWLNTPQAPMEASGTSGMKAALNGVPSLSVLDGWWIEGHIEGITGWSIGENNRQSGNYSADASLDAESLYEKLENAVLPIFYTNRDAYTNVMAHAIALNGSFFNTHRMIQEYVLNAYFH